MCCQDLQLLHFFLRLSLHKSDSKNEDFSFQSSSIELLSNDEETGGYMYIQDRRKYHSYNEWQKN